MSLWRSQQTALAEYQASLDNRSRKKFNPPLRFTLEGYFLHNFYAYARLFDEVFLLTSSTWLLAEAAFAYNNHSDKIARNLSFYALELI